MEKQNGYRVSVGRRIGASVLAVLFGLLHPLLLMGQVMLPFTGCCAGVCLGVFLATYAGMIPLVIYACVLAASSVILMGMQLSLVSFPMVFLPLVIIVRGVRRRKEFFGQLRGAIFSGLVGAVLSYLLLVAFYGPDFIAQAFGTIKEIFDQTKTLTWLLYAPVFKEMGLATTANDFAELYYQTLKQLQIIYERTLLANLCGSALITGALSVMWGNWISARHGDATAQSFKGLFAWYLPHNVTLGLIMIYGCAYATAYTPLTGAVTAWMIVRTTVRLVFAAQAMASFDRRQKSVGASVSRRVVMLILMVIVMTVVGGSTSIGSTGLLALFGVMSALFGRRGVVRKYFPENSNNDGINE